MDKASLFGLSMDILKGFFRKVFLLIVSVLGICLDAIGGIFLVIFLLSSYCSIINLQEYYLLVLI